MNKWDGKQINMIRYWREVNTNNSEIEVIYRAQKLKKLVATHP